MKDIDTNSIDMVLVDLPYGTTQCKWDSILPLKDLWTEYNRIVKDNGAMLFHCAQPFTSNLIMSNPKNFKYEWIWEKSKASNYLNAKKQPLRAHESIAVFYRRPCTYNPQMTQGEAYNKGTALRETDVYGSQRAVEVKSDGERYPRTVQYFVTAEKEGKLHPTQKPIALAEYFVKTFSNAGDTVLDNTMGSGTTGVACVNLDREFIGIEKDRKYFDIAVERISEAEDYI
ncbi:MAG: DNA-methyltransferase [Paracoccaceae bacterium]|jgi:site-specific DNA-methyltransferase (adenine-specific)